MLKEGLAVGDEVLQVASGEAAGAYDIVVYISVSGNTSACGAFVRFIVLYARMLPVMAVSTSAAAEIVGNRRFLPPDRIDRNRVMSISRLPDKPVASIVPEYAAERRIAVCRMELQ